MPNITINGLNHYYEDLGKGGGEPVMMIHGATNNSRQIWTNVEALSKDFHVVAPDLRGHGRSAHPDSMPVTAWPDDIVALIDQLGIDKIHVHGQTLGTRIAMRFAIDHPSRVKSLILDSSILVDTPGGDAILTRSLNPEQMTPERRKYMEGVHGRDWEQVIRNYWKLRQDLEWRRHYDLRESCKEIQCPTLVMRGDTDEPIHPIEHSWDIYRRVPKARLLILSQKDYRIGIGAPELFYRFTREFVQHVAAGEAY